MIPALADCGGDMNELLLCSISTKRYPSRIEQFKPECPDLLVLTGEETGVLKHLILV